MKRITRDQKLTPEEVEKSNSIRNKIDAELPELIERHQAKGMTVRELIEKLSNFDDDAKVFVYTHRINQIEEVGPAHDDDPEGSAIIYMMD